MFYLKIIHFIRRKTIKNKIKMEITVAPMVDSTVWEMPYLLKGLDMIKAELNDEYHFIFARTNVPQEIQQFKDCVKKDKKNILILLSDEAGIRPYFLDELFLVFRTYSNKNLYDDKKIFAIPCGYCGGSAMSYNNHQYLDMEKDKAPLIDREYDIFYSAQMSPNRIECVNNLMKIKDKFNTIINVTDGFAKGVSLVEYYNLMQNSKIAIVPNGAVVPESFRYFEAFESNCVVITSFPRNIDLYNNWFYDNSPAVFINNWNELTENLIRNLLTDENLKKYEIENKKYFNNNLSSKAISSYMLNVINKNN